MDCKVYNRVKMETKDSRDSCSKLEYNKKTDFSGRYEVELSYTVFSTILSEFQLKTDYCSGLDVSLERLITRICLCDSFYIHNLDVALLIYNAYEFSDLLSFLEYFWGKSAYNLKIGENNVCNRLLFFCKKNGGSGFQLWVVWFGLYCLLYTENG